MIRSSDLERTFLLRKWLSDNKISADLSARVTRYVLLAYEMHQQRLDRSKVELLKVLSGPLNIELQQELFEPYLSWNAFLGNYATECVAAMRKLCTTAVAKLGLSKGDAVFCIGSES